MLNKNLYRKRLRESRANSGLSTRDVGKAIGYCDGSHLTQWECGTFFPRIESLANLCALYHVDPNYLTGMSDHPFYVDVNHCPQLIASQLKKARQASELSAADVSRRIPAGRAVVFKWESGVRTPKLLSLMKLCDIYQVTPNYLLGWDNNNNKRGYKNAK